MTQSRPGRNAPRLGTVGLALLSLLMVFLPSVSAHAEAGPPPPPTGPQGYLVASVEGVSADAVTSVYENVGASWNFVKVDGVEYVMTLPPGIYTAEFTDTQTGVTRWYGGGTDASTATTFTISEESFTRISDNFPGPPPIPGGYVTMSGTPRVGLPMTAVTGWDPDPSVTVTYAWKSTIGAVLGTTNTFTAADPFPVTLEATGHKSGYADTTVKKSIAIFNANELVITLQVDPVTGKSGQFGFSNNQGVEAPVEVKLNGATYASITVPAGMPGAEGTASVPFSNLAPGDFISAGLSSYAVPLSWRPTIAQTEAAAGSALPVTGVGFAPGTQVVLTLHSTPISLGTLSVGADGTLSGEVVIPAGVTAGNHTVAFSVDGVMRGQAPLTVTVPAVATPTATVPAAAAPTGTASDGKLLAATGPDVGALGSIGGILLFGGFISILIGSRRRAKSRV